jgi:NTP pyrophosphatase (non-canonical NTP hydrolase)
MSDDPAVPNRRHGDFSLGSSIWPGVSKLVEECGEVVQVAGKIMGTGGERRHWDGSDLKARLEEELGDLAAAMWFVERNCGLSEDAITERMKKKLDTFEGWRATGDPAPDPFPPLRPCAYEQCLDCNPGYVERPNMPPYRCSEIQCASCKVSQAEGGDVLCAPCQALRNA